MPGLLTSSLGISLISDLCRLLSTSIPALVIQKKKLTGATLVTGGLGSLGLLVASWLSERSRVLEGFDIILVGRTGRAEDSAMLQNLLERSQDLLVISRCDVSSTEDADSIVHRSCQVGYLVTKYCIKHSIQF